MTEETHALQKRFQELAGRAFRSGRDTYSEFLTLAEQDILRQTPFPGAAAPYTLWGGYDEAERKLACFNSGATGAEATPPPMQCLCIQPLAKKFADPLSHRDFLGAVLALGIRRSVLGDLLVSKNSAYLFCLAELADFICEHLTQVRHTTVRCIPADRLPEEALPQLETRELVVASLRLDAIIAALYHLSRGESQQLVEKGRVFVSDRQILSSSYAPKPGERISVRGYGRFFYEGIRLETRKGRIRVSLRF